MVWPGPLGEGRACRLLARHVFPGRAPDSSLSPPASLPRPSPSVKMAATAQIFPGLTGKGQKVSLLCSLFKPHWLLPFPRPSKETESAFRFCLLMSVCPEGSQAYSSRASVPSKKTCHVLAGSAQETCLRRGTTSCASSRQADVTRPAQLQLPARSVLPLALS